MHPAHLLKPACLAAALVVALPGHAALQGRNLDADAGTFEAYYDTALNITWLADAHYAQTSGFDADGRLNFFDANTWAAALSIGGVSDWRLPGVTPVNNASFDFSFSNDGSTDRGYALAGTGWGLHSEMGHLFYATLNNSAFALTNSGPFSNLQPDDYWTNAAIGALSTTAFFFNQGIGLQDGASRGFTLNAWPVHDGDVSAPVPEPESYALMLLGLAGMAAVARRKPDGAAP